MNESDFGALIPVFLLVVMVLAGERFRYTWRAKSENWIAKAWIYGLLVVITFFALAFYPFTNNY